MLGKKMYRKAAPAFEASAASQKVRTARGGNWSEEEKSELLSLLSDAMPTTFWKLSESLQKSTWEQYAAELQSRMTERGLDMVARTGGAVMSKFIEICSLARKKSSDGTRLDYESTALDVYSRTRASLANASSTEQIHGDDHDEPDRSEGRVPFLEAALSSQAAAATAVDVSAHKPTKTKSIGSNARFQGDARLATIESVAVSARQGGAQPQAVSSRNRVKAASSAADRADMHAALLTIQDRTLYSSAGSDEALQRARAEERRLVALRASGVVKDAALGVMTSAQPTFSAAAVCALIFSIATNVEKLSAADAREPEHAAASTAAITTAGKRRRGDEDRVSHDDGEDATEA